jgi:predicted transposase YbfD/YdcC
VAKARGRVETRAVHCRPIDAETFGFPFAAQLALIRRHRHYLCDGHDEEGFTYVVTSRVATRASPDDLLTFSRGHWGIETRVHYTRDANYHEDRCRIRHATTAHVCATLRTLACWLLGKKANGHRRNTRRRQHIRLTRRAGPAVRLILDPDP